MNGWCIVIGLDRLAAAARLRSRHDLDACVAGDEVWLRGKTVPSDERQLARLIPGSLAFVILPDDQLRPIGKLLPKGQLPQGAWLPLETLLEIRLPDTATSLPPPPAGVRISLIRSTQEQAADLLLVDFSEWSRYAETAPAWRLEVCAFAVSENHDALIRGRPLPPLAGLRLVTRGGIAVPAGWTWRPAVEPGVLRHTMQLEDGDLALVTVTKSDLCSDIAEFQWQIVRESDWVQGSRVAVRDTAEVIHGRE